MYKFEYETYGTVVDPYKPTLVLLHEGLGSVSMWRDFPAALHSATGLPVFVYSRRGYGNSDPAELPRSVNFMHEEAHLLGSILQQMKIYNPILFGHSDGGSIALIYAGSDPPLKPRKLILEAPHVFIEELTIRTIASAREQYEKGTLKTRLGKYHHNVDHTFTGWTGVWLDPAFRYWNIEEYLPKISIPALVIQGEEDEYGTLLQVSLIERGCRGPLETLTLPRCGHSCHREAPNEVIEAVTLFLQKNHADEIDNS
jgi:pimeloyl-ACP methyl ester carboxylesterase